MTDRFDEDMMEDLMAEAPEGGSAADEFDEADEAEAFDEFDEGDEADEFDEFDEDSLEESTDSYEGADEFEEAVTDALEAEDADEFFGGLGGFLKKVGRGVGSVARTVAPIAKLIPIPQAQLIGQAADLIGGVLADEGDEFDALEELADFAEEEDGFDALSPAIAGIAIKGALKHKTATLARPHRRQLVKTVAAVTRHIARRHGARAVVAVPAIVRHARKILIRRRLPAKHLPQLVARAARLAVRSPRVLRKLATVGAHMHAGHTGHAGHRRYRRGRLHGVGPKRYGVSGFSGTGAYRTGGGTRGSYYRAGKAGYGGTYGSYGGTSLRSGGGVATAHCPHCQRRALRFSGPVTVTIEQR